MRRIGAGLVIMSLLMFCLERFILTSALSDDTIMPAYKLRLQKSCEDFHAKMSGMIRDAEDLCLRIDTLLDQIPEDSPTAAVRGQLEESQTDADNYLKAIQSYRQETTKACNGIMEPVSKSEAIGRAKQYEEQLQKAHSEFQSGQHYFSDAVQKHNNAVQTLNEIARQEKKEKVVDLKEFAYPQSSY